MNNKIKVGIMLLFIFLFGLLIGNFMRIAIPLRLFHHYGHPRFFRQRKPLAERFSRVFTNRIIKEIEPNKDQKEDFIRIIKKYEKKFIENNDNHMFNMIELMKEMENELKPILNKEQQDKFREKTQRLEQGFFRRKKK